jgi:hypothetical protein
MKYISNTIKGESYVKDESYFLKKIEKSPFFGMWKNRKGTTLELAKKLRRKAWLGEE